MKIFNILFLGFFLFYSHNAETTATSKDAEKVIVKVADDIITEHDLQSFIKLRRINNGLEITGTVTKQERKLALNELIEQILKLNKAKTFCKNMLKQKYFVTNTEVQDMIKSVAAQYDKTYAEYFKALEFYGIDKKIAKDYWETYIAWSKYIQYSYSHMINISEHNIKEYMDKHKESAKIPQYLLARISVLIKGDENTAKNKIDEIYQELARGASFPELAKQHSHTPEASKGGDMGWVPATYIPENIQATLNNLQIGQYSDCQKEGNAYVIYLLRNKRESNAQKITMQVRLITLESMEQYEVEQFNHLAQKYAAQKNKHIDSFIKTVVEEFKGKLKITPVKNIDLAEVDPQLSALLRQFNTNDISPMINTDSGILVFCIVRKTIHDTILTADEVRNILLDKAFTDYSKKEVKDLYRTAYIEYL